jgi:hypothetical protein
MNRVGPALLAVFGGVLVLVAALLPEFTSGGIGFSPLDPASLGWTARLVGTLVQVGLLLVPAAMVALGQGRGPAGGILIGAGVLGLTVRLVRIFQLGQEPSLDPAIGSFLDLLADGAALTAGILTLTSSHDDELEELEEEDGVLLEAEEAVLAPPPGEPETG